MFEAEFIPELCDSVGLVQLSCNTLKGWIGGENYHRDFPCLTFSEKLSGENHIVLLTEDGQIYTLGCAEQGRLGRVGELFVGRGGRRGLSLPLLPDIVHAKNRRVVFAGEHLIYYLVNPNLT